MPLRAKLTLITLFVAVVPLVMSTSQSLRLHQSALADALFRLHATAATLGGEVFEQQLAQTADSFRSSALDTIDWASLSADEQQAALWVIYGQFGSSGVVTLTRRDGTTSRAYVTGASTESKGHPALSSDDVERFREVSPPGEARVNVGAALRTERGAILLPLSVTDRGQGRPSAELSLGIDVEPTCIALGKAKPEQGHILLLDRWSRRVCLDGSVADLSSAPDSLAPILKDNLTRYTRTDGTASLEGALTQSVYGFRVVVEQPSAVLIAPARRLLKEAVFWLAIGVAIALVCAWVLGQDLLKPLSRLIHAAEQIALGNLNGTVQLGARRDELATLGAAFNTMAKAISERDSEIQGWNAELRDRVDERSRQLEEAQGALLRSQKMAGLAAATAGMAHEMNNPLTSIMGMAQMLRSRLSRNASASPEQEMAKAVVDESRRLAELLKQVTTLASQDDADEDLRAVSARHLIDGILLAHRDKLNELQLETSTSYLTEQPLLGNAYYLNTVLSELLSNAMQALQSTVLNRPRRISWVVRETEHRWVEITIEDTGRGIPAEFLDRVFEPFFTTRPMGTEKGLGLAQVYQLIAAQNGSIVVTSELDSWTRFRIQLPIAKQGTLLT